MKLWQPYRPSAAAPWNINRVVHLHRRAGFAATWSEIQRDLHDGPQAAVERVLRGKSRRDGLREDFASMSDVIGRAAVSSNRPERLKAWWVYRMLFSANPLAEKLALMWHNHFATSNLKVNDLALMHRQNEIFRRLGRAPFSELLSAVVHDPAMLIWLDADSNRRGVANENLAREIMELFTLGIGNYSEKDIKEAARSLTGWTVRNQNFFADQDRHDDGVKVVLGQRGAWDGDDVVRILCEHPATPKRLAWRLGRTFFGEDSLSEEAIAELADGLRRRNLNIGWAVATILRSERFFFSDNIRSRVAEPIEFVIGAIRALELFDSPPSTLLLAEWSARLGQDLFYPPNVGGWNGGQDWLSSRYIVARANFGAALMSGRLHANSAGLDLSTFVNRHGVGDDSLRFFSELLIGRPLNRELQSRLVEALAANSSNSPADGNIVALLLALPESQLN